MFWPYKRHKYRLGDCFLPKILMKKFVRHPPRFLKIWSALTTFCHVLSFNWFRDLVRMNFKVSHQYKFHEAFWETWMFMGLFFPSHQIGLFGNSPMIIWALNGFVFKGWRVEPVIDPQMMMNYEGERNTIFTSWHKRNHLLFNFFYILIHS